MSLTALGDGVIGIEAIYKALEKAGFDGYSTLEIAGEEAVLKSFDFLKKLGAN
jgi:inosose dehydratase